MGNLAWIIFRQKNQNPQKPQNIIHVKINPLTVHFEHHTDHSFNTFAKFSEKLTFLTPLYHCLDVLLKKIKFFGKPS